MDKKVVIGVAVVGILSYLGYRLFKEIDNIDFDFMGENINEDYHATTTNSRTFGNAKGKEPGLSKPMA
jgi:hypothetical protein